VWSPRPTAKSVGAPIDGGTLLLLELVSLLTVLEEPAASEERTVLDEVVVELDSFKVPPFAIGQD
jgi:hypothetical protein